MKRKSLRKRSSPSLTVMIRQTWNVTMLVGKGVIQEDLLEGFLIAEGRTTEKQIRR